MRIILAAPTQRHQTLLHTEASYLYVNQYIEQTGGIRCRSLARLSNTPQNHELLLKLYPSLKPAGTDGATA